MDTEIEGTSVALYNFLFHGIPFQQSQEIRGTSPATEHTDIKATSSDAESMEIIPSRAHTLLLPPMDPLLLPPMNPWLLRMDPLMEGTSATEIMGSLSPRMDPLMDETSATESTGSLSPRMDPLMDETSATEITGSLSFQMDPLMDETSATESTSSLSPRMNPLMDETSATESTGLLSYRMDRPIQGTAHAESTESGQASGQASGVSSGQATESGQSTGSIFRVPEHIRYPVDYPVDKPVDPPKVVLEEKKGDYPVEKESRVKEKESQVKYPVAKIRSSGVSNFVPKFVSIGPYYHKNKNLKHMQDLKIQCIQEIGKIPLKEMDIDAEFLRQFMVSDSVRKARDFYKEPVDLGDEDFVKMLFLDSCFIIRTILAIYKPIQSMSLLDVRIKDVRSDLLLLENQIPLFFIKKVYEWNLNNLKGKNIPQFNTVLEWFIRLDMPWRINGHAMSSEAAHLLDLYWRCSLSPRMYLKLTSDKRFCSETERDLSNSSEIDPSNNEQKDMVIEDATELQQMAGIKFKKFKDKGNLDVIFSNGIMWMPRLKIDSRQITLLKNLVVFENYYKPCLGIFSCYMKLMNTLIDSENDVKLLQRCGVICNTLSSHEEAVTFFKDIGDLCLTDNNANPFSDVNEKVNNYYKSCWHRTWASLINNYFSTPWKIISVVAAVILLLLSAGQTIYTILGYYHTKN